MLGARPVLDSVTHHQCEGRPPAFQAARRAPSNSAVASAALEGRRPLPHLRAHQTPGIPCALCIQGEWIMHRSGILCRGKADVCLYVIACDKREAFAQGSESDEAIHSFLARCWIASRSLSSGDASRRPVGSRCWERRGSLRIESGMRKCCGIIRCRPGLELGPITTSGCCVKLERRFC